MAGDSSGGHLALTLVLAQRQTQLPLPALTALMSPLTDEALTGDGMERNEPFDWVDRAMNRTWVAWFGNGIDPTDPRVSPLRAELRGLPPSYLQAGTAEVSHDQIVEFVARGHNQGVDVTLEPWPDMNHVFRTFSNLHPAGRQAQARLGEVIDRRQPPRRAVA